ncbi:MAG: carbohydrate ABC transporter permease [Peptococcales bacterium]|jgi:putative aldouronate transport system permease protein
MKQSSSYKTFSLFNYIFLSLLGLIIIIPFMNIIAKSLSSYSAIAANKVFIWPVEFNIDSYRIIFRDKALIRSLFVTIFITLTGTIISLVSTLTLAYPLSRPYFMYRGVILKLILFTFLFGAPMIPTFLWIRTLGLYDSIWALMLPVAIAPYYFFILSSFLNEFPNELIEAARIDGCSEIRSLFLIVIPLIKPALATFSLFYAVGYWNTYMRAIMYLKNKKLMPLQVRLMSILLETEMRTDGVEHIGIFRMSPESVRMATILFSTVPILAVYPYLQKYFTAGLQMGAIKG